jgi:hypothetical protein
VKMRVMPLFRPTNPIDIVINLIVHGAKTRYGR